MKQSEFISVIGYNGNFAVVDKKMKAKLASKSLDQLIEEGQFKAAFCLSFFTGEQDRQALLDAYNKLCGANYSGKELERLFGVFSVPENVKVQQV